MDSCDDLRGGGGCLERASSSQDESMKSARGWMGREMWCVVRDVPFTPPETSWPSSSARAVRNAQAVRDVVYRSSGASNPGVAAPDCLGNGQTLVWLGLGTF